MPSEVVVVGQVARDLVVEVPDAPDAGSSAEVQHRQEVLGGKGANQAVALSQLGTSVSLVGVVGEDLVGDALRARARADRIGTTHVVRRRGAETALIVDVVDEHGRRRYLEHIPAATLVTETDVAAAAAPISAACSLIVQLQQPAPAALLAARLAHTAGTRVVLDGAPEDPDLTDELLALSDVVRAGAHETETLTGQPVADLETAVRAAAELRRRGPSLVVLEVSGQGNLFAGPDGTWFVPDVETDVVDTTGAGDALVATLTAALTRRRPLETAACLAVAAAAATTEHAGGRPRLSRPALDRLRPEHAEEVQA
ncbi:MULTISPECIES: PfkB family carbohydrate kinase [unclassified Amycolatopsis]|uniref:PfkB family carbohydrate kinase n=1 Tax=unclassified Amycolatopsis TaxID=2618356 RepID=UPI002E122F48|nr:MULTISPECIES: PfkB family carbohydrate kinase [unclassified Amycolatopsis]WSK77990.1 PfkB family carbohydrate kinase [Amycolatopsis sp. NBC_01286]